MSKTRDITNSVAERFYNLYCDEVGGKAYNGDPLPRWDEFAKDEKKEKQANAWRAVADFAIESAQQPCVAQAYTPTSEEIAEAEERNRKYERQSIWINASSSYCRAGVEPEGAIEGADKLLAAFEERFHKA